MGRLNTGGATLLESTKMKDGAKPPLMSFRFADVELGVQDEHGHEVTSAVMIQTHYNAAEASTAPPSRRGDRKSVGSGKSVSVRVDLGGRRSIKKKMQKN